jgi:hypothetical protein
MRGLSYMWHGDLNTLITNNITVPGFLCLKIQFEEQQAIETYAQKFFYLFYKGGEQKKTKICIYLSITKEDAQERMK